MCYLAGYDENGSYDGEDGGKHDASRVSIYAACHFRTESETYYVCEEGVDLFKDGHRRSRYTVRIGLSALSSEQPQVKDTEVAIIRSTGEYLTLWNQDNP